MTKEAWKKNDALMKVALSKMGIIFNRNRKTWEPHAYIGSHEFVCYDADDTQVLEGPNDPGSLGEISYFYTWVHNKEKVINNIFFGISNYEELKIKVDLLA